MSKKRKGFNIESLRNLPQYRDLSNEEFEEAVSNLLREETKELAQQYFDNFQKDYVLGDLKANDRIALEIICWLYAQVRYNQDRIVDYQNAKDDPYADKGIKSLVADNEKIIKSITILENQLSISRSARLKEEGTEVVDVIQALREKASKFLEQKLHYIFCPKCNMLLANIWVLYRNEPDAYDLKFICKREEKGKACNTEVIVKPGDLVEETSGALRKIKPEDFIDEASS